MREYHHQKKKKKQSIGESGGSRIGEWLIGNCVKYYKNPSAGRIEKWEKMRKKGQTKRSRAQVPSGRSQNNYYEKERGRRGGEGGVVGKGKSHNASRECNKDSGGPKDHTKTGERVVGGGGGGFWEKFPSMVLREPAGSRLVKDGFHRKNPTWLRGKKILKKKKANNQTVPAHESEGNFFGGVVVRKRPGGRCSDIQKQRRWIKIKRKERRETSVLKHRASGDHIEGG